MASITKKTFGGRTYYYARECKRVDGKPKIVWQKYLGRIEDIIAAADATKSAALIAAPEPREAVITEFGAVTALFDVAQRLDLVGTIDRHVPKRGRGPSVGTYLLAATINRAVDPCSKARIGDWFDQTALRRLLPIDAGQLTSQRFWENMDRMPTEKIAAIEQDLVAAMVRNFGIDTRRVLLDATNFFTFIDTFNDRSELAQRGKSKEGRTALRIVGLALLVAADFHVPLLHATYPGNQPDAKTFASLTDRLVSRYRDLAQGAEHVTVVFDKGNNSKDNLVAVEGSPYHFVGSLVPGHHPDLLEIATSEFDPLTAEGLPGVLSYRTTRTVFGTERTVVVTWNENLFVAQSQSLLREIGKRQKYLRELQEQLQRRRSGEVKGGKSPTVGGTQKKVDGWLKARHMKDLFQVSVTEREGLPDVSATFDAAAWESLQKTLLGKTILFTDNGDWADADIVRAYRGQHEVETAFRCLKDPHHISLRPQHHWTDQKVEVHVFTCVLALLLCSLLQREAHQRGIDRSIPDLLDQLGQIREVAVVYPSADGQPAPQVKLTLSRMDEAQRQLYDGLGLANHRIA